MKSGANWKESNSVATRQVSVISPSLSPDYVEVFRHLRASKTDAEGIPKL